MMPSPSLYIRVLCLRSFATSHALTFLSIVDSSLFLALSLVRRQLPACAQPRSFFFFFSVSALLLFISSVVEEIFCLTTI